MSLSTSARKISLFFKRLPKNLRSNRWWVIWNHQLFLSSSRTMVTDTATKSPDTIADWWRGSDHYIAWYLRGFPMRAIKSGRHALFLPELGMFGNMTKRLATALTTADSLGLGHVIVPRSAEFYGGIFNRGIYERDNRAAWWMCDTGRYSGPPVQVLHKKDFLSGNQLPTEALATYSRDAWADLYAALASKPASRKLPNSHLVIHLRGGDVFGPRKPSSYGQPPLAFYERILDHEDWSAVSVVHQDEKNPVLKPLLETCKTRGIPVTTHSGAVRDDIAELLRASTLVAGRGTFMPAVVGLSRNVKRVFYFHDKFSLHPPVADVELIRVTDAEGTYVRDVLSNNWENSDYQRDLMLHYPPSNLEFSTLD